MLSFYAQWAKAAACFEDVLGVERDYASSRVSRRAQFRFVIKMRPDWPFSVGPALQSLTDDSVVYARLRCASSAPYFLPTIYMAYNSHYRSANARTDMCRVGRPRIERGTFTHGLARTLPL